MQAALEDVTVEDSIGRYIVSLTTATREHPQVLVGASPRGSLALMLLARGVAAMAGRDYVVPEDVKQVAVAALAHRITLRPEMWLRRVDSASVVANVLQQVPAPASAARPQHSAGVAPSGHGDHGGHSDPRGHRGGGGPKQSPRRGARLPHGEGPYGMDLRANGTFDLALTGTALRWGYHEVGPAAAYAIACDGLLLSSTAMTPAGVIRVQPLMPAFRADETMPRASALVGVHRFCRPGEGVELACLRCYGP